MRRSLTDGWVAVLAVMGAAYCADSPQSAVVGEPLVSESGGVRTVVNRTPRWSPADEWTISEEPVLTIGRMDGPEAYLFHRIRGVTRLTDGVVVVLNSGNGQIRYYSPDGNHLRSVSREGDGPGEMRGGRWLDRIEENVVQVTHTNGRLRFGPDGSLMADDRLDWSRLQALSNAVGLTGSAGFLMESCRFPAPLFLGDDVLLCAATNTDARFIPEHPGLHHSLALVARTEWALEAADTIGIFNNRTLVVQYSGGWKVPIFPDPPYGARGRMRVGGSPAHFFYTPADAYRIEIYMLRSPLRRLVIERIGGLRPPTELEIASLDRTLGRGPVTMSAADFHSIVTPADSLSIVADAAYVDALQAVWVPLDEPPGVVDVFDAEGIYLGQVSLPTRAFTIHEIGEEYILGVATGEFDEEYVLMFRLDRGTRD